MLTSREVLHIIRERFLWQIGVKPKRLEIIEFANLPVQGLVLVSTGVLQLVKLSACNALNGKLKYKR